MLRLTLLLVVLASPVLAHELWVEPAPFQPAIGAPVKARLVNGQGFEGLELSYLPKTFVRFAVIAAGVETPVTGRIGDRPALAVDRLADGLAVAVYQSTPSTVAYADFAKFESFGAHKDLGDVRAAHVARGLEVGPFTEVYTRFSKALIGVGSGVGSDARLGLETELVALDNPYTTDPAAGVRVQLYYADAVRAEAQVELFERAADGTVAITLHRTDADGIVVLPVVAGRSYMADAVVLREPAADLAQQHAAVWESLWANLTFAVPD